MIHPPAFGINGSLKCENNHGRADVAWITVFLLFFNNGKSIGQIRFIFTGETQEEADTFEWEHTNAENVSEERPVKPPYELSHISSSKPLSH